MIFPAIIKLKNFIKNIGFIQKPAIHYKTESKQEEIEENLINTYHEKVKDFINSRKKKISL